MVSSLKLTSSSLVNKYISIFSDQEGSEVGVLLTSGVLFSGVLNSLFSLLSELSTLLSSVQRVLDWGKNIEVELSRFARKEIKLNDDWPSKGVVEFRNVGLRYRDREVLRGIEFRTESHENVS